MTSRLDWTKARTAQLTIGIHEDPLDILARKAAEFLGERRKPRKFDRRSDFRGLEGLGGKQTEHLRALKGSKMGPASAGRVLSDDERREVEERLREQGVLNTAPRR